MPDIYSAEWYEAVREAINAEVATMKGVPEGSFVVKIEIVGDGASPYVAEGTERHFLVSIEEGHCNWYREVDGDEDGVRLDYRFRGPATVFDEVAAGLGDPIDAALQGKVKVRGDMRFLMRQAALVNTLLHAYSSGVETSWPHGTPPYAAIAPRAVNA